MFDKYCYELKNIILNSKKEKDLLRHEYIGTEHLLLSILKSNNNISRVLNKKYNINYNLFMKYIIDNIGYGNDTNYYTIYTPLVKNIFIENNNYSKVNTETLFYNILNNDCTAVRILFTLGIDISKLQNEFNVKIEKNKTKRKFMLDEIGINLNEKAKNKLIDPAIDRDKEISKIVEILNRRLKNNPILIGDAGVGKTAIVEDIANRINNNEIPTLKNKKIISINTASMVSGTKYRGEFEERVKELIKEAEEDENIILFIDEIHTLVGAGGAEGAIDASNIFKPALARGNIKCIGATTKEEYEKYIENDNALDRRFQKVIIKEPDYESVKNILFKLKPIYENYHNVKISNSVIELIINLSNRYLNKRKNPDKSIDILDEVSAKVSIRPNKSEIEIHNLNHELEKISNEKNLSIIRHNYEEAYKLKCIEKKIESSINIISLKNKYKYKTVTKNDVFNVIKDKLDIPIFNLSYKSIKEKLNNEIYYKPAFDYLCNVVKNYRIDKDNNNLILFYGEKGMGKSTIAEAFSKIILKDNVIRLNMNEFSDYSSISKIIGSDIKDKCIIDEIKNKSNLIIILDDINKCDRRILNLFIDAHYNGYINKYNNEKIYTNNLTIIMTLDKKCTSVGFNKSNTDLDFIIDRVNNILIFEKNNNNMNKLISKKLEEKNIIPSKNIICDIISNLKYDDMNYILLDNLILKYYNTIDTYQKK